MRGPPPPTSHADLMDALRTQGAHVNAQLAAMFQIMENMEINVVRIDGRVESLEAKGRTYHLFGERMKATLIAWGIAAGAIWWLVKAKIAALFGVAP